MSTLPALDPALPPVERSLAAIARTRAAGLHALGHFAGVVARAHEPGRSELELVPPTWSADGTARSCTEVALLVDLTLGSAIRGALGPGLRLATISLAIDHLATAAPGPLGATGLAQRVDAAALEGQGRSEVVDVHGAHVASASGWFAALPPPADRPLPPVPWESEGAAEPALSPGDLTDDEREVHEELVAASERAVREGTSAPDVLCAPVADGVVRTGERVSYRLPTGPVLGNRVRQVQGGALYGAAATAAEVAAGGGWEVATGYVQFLRPVSAGVSDVGARVLRRGRRAVFTDVRVEAAGRTAVAGRFTLRPARCD